MIQDTNLCDEMKRVFGAYPCKWALNYAWAGNVLLLDPKKFREFLRRTHGYKDDAEPHELDVVFVLRKFGQEGLDVLARTLKPTPRNREPWSKGQESDWSIKK